MTFLKEPRFCEHKNKHPEYTSHTHCLDCGYKQCDEDAKQLIDSFLKNIQRPKRQGTIVSPINLIVVVFLVTLAGIKLAAGDVDFWFWAYLVLAALNLWIA